MTVTVIGKTGTVPNNLRDPYEIKIFNNSLGILVAKKLLTVALDELSANFSRLLGPQLTWLLS
jgi:hypothetical protein